MNDQSEETATITTAGPQDILPEPEPVELPELTDLPNVDFKPAEDPNYRREGTPPSPEPEMALVDPTNISAQKELTEFAVIARGLFLNWKNQEILDELAKTNRVMSLRTLHRLLKRPDFQAYYQQYRGGMLSGVDNRVMDLFRQVGPEAAAKIVRLMRGAESERLQYDAAMSILKEAGFISKEDTKTPPISITVEALKQLVGEGQRFLKPVITVNAEVEP